MKWPPWNEISGLTRPLNRNPRVEAGWNRVSGAPLVADAQLAFGRHEVSPVLYFAVGIEKEERARQSQKLREMLSTPPTANSNTILVGHNANLKEATGVWPKKEGDAHVFRPGGGGFVYVGDVTAEEWVRVAEAAAAR